MARYVRWQTYYSVGSDLLDKQHQQILDMIDRLYDATQSKASGDVVRSVLDQLVEYTMIHFRDEEALMLDLGFPGLAEHRILHRKMRETTLSIREQSHLVVESDLLQFLKQWWVNHIQQCDRQYAPYLRMARTSS